MRFKSVKEIEDYAIEILGIPYVKFDGLEPEVCSEIIEGLSICFNRYPALKNALCAIGDTKYINEQYNLVNSSMNVKKIKWDDDFLQDEGELLNAISVGNHRLLIKDKKVIELWEYIAISYKDELRNKTLTELEKNSKYGAETGYFTKSSISFFSKIIHEIGHILDFIMNLSHTKEFVELIGTNVETFQKNISEYSTNSVSDILAEAFTEYILSPNPNDLVKSIGTFIDEKYKKYEHSKIFNVNHRYKRHLIEDTDKKIKQTR